MRFSLPSHARGPAASIGLLGVLSILIAGMLGILAWDEKRPLPRDAKEPAWSLSERRGCLTDISYPIQVR
jgi:hypothetical protein